MQSSPRLKYRPSNVGAMIITPTKQQFRQIRGEAAAPTGECLSSSATVYGVIVEIGRLEPGGANFRQVIKATLGYKWERLLIAIVSVVIAIANRSHG